MARRWTRRFTDGTLLRNVVLRDLTMPVRLLMRTGIIPPFVMIDLTFTMRANHVTRHVLMVAPV